MMQIFKAKQNTISTINSLVSSVINSTTKKAAAPVYTINTQIFVPAEILEVQISEDIFDNLARAYYS